MINKHTITCQLDISVYQILDFTENGFPITIGISKILEKKMNQEVTDNEFEAISNAFLMRDSEYSSVNIEDIPGYEWLFYKIVNEHWMMIVNQYKNLGLKCTIKNPHRYKIELPDNRIIAPSVTIHSLEPEELAIDFDKIPEKTEFKELPDGNLELVRAGEDFPSNDLMEKIAIEYWKMAGPFFEAYPEPVESTPFPFDKIVKIGERAFEGYRGNLYIDLPNCKEVGELAFYQCIGLRSVSMPNLQKLDYGAFCDCHFLKAFSYPEHITSIGESAFHGCMNLKDFQKEEESITKFPENVTIGNDAFAYTPMDYLSNNPIYDPSIPEDEDWNKEL